MFDRNADATCIATWQQKFCLPDVQLKEYQPFNKFLFITYFEQQIPIEHRLCLLSTLVFRCLEPEMSLQHSMLQKVKTNESHLNPHFHKPVIGFKMTLWQPNSRSGTEPTGSQEPSPGKDQVQLAKGDCATLPLLQLPPPATDSNMILYKNKPFLLIINLRDCQCVSHMKNQLK